MANWAVERRLDYIDWLLTRRGWVQREDLAQMFGVSHNQVTVDLREWDRLYPGAMAYNHRVRRYEAREDYVARRGMDRPEITEAMRLLCAAGHPMGFSDPTP